MRADNRLTLVTALNAARCCQELLPATCAFLQSPLFLVAVLAGLGDRDFGCVDFMVGLLAEHAEDLGKPSARHLGGKVRKLPSLKRDCDRRTTSTGENAWRRDTRSHA